MNLLEKYCITSPEKLDLEAIANAEHLIIEEADLSSHLGRIAFGEGYGLIKVSNTIREPGQRNFVIAHEMGHYFNERACRKSCTALDLTNYKSSFDKERTANRFAAELLMPEEWIKKFTRKKVPGTELIKSIASCFSVSLTAAAIRYAEKGPYPSAVIFSTAAKVKWSVINQHFPFGYIPVGYEVNNNSWAGDYFKEGTINEEVNDVLADSWFLEDRGYKRDFFIKEQNFIMPNYNSVLTVLWSVN